MFLFKLEFCLSIAEMSDLCSYKDYLGFNCEEPFFQTMSGNGAAVLEKKRDLQPWVSDRFHAYFIFVLFFSTGKIFCSIFLHVKAKFLHMAEFFSTGTACGACDKYEVWFHALSFSIQLCLTLTHVSYEASLLKHQVCFSLRDP